MIPIVLQILILVDDIGAVFHRGRVIVAGLTKTNRILGIVIALNKGHILTHDRRKQPFQRADTVGALTLILVYGIQGVVAAKEGSVRLGNTVDGQRIQHLLHPSGVMRGNLKIRAGQENDLFFCRRYRCHR